MNILLQPEMNLYNKIYEHSNIFEIIAYLQLLNCIKETFRMCEQIKSVRLDVILFLMTFFAHIISMRNGNI